MNNPDNAGRMQRINQRMESGELTEETIDEDEDYMNLINEPGFMQNMMQLLQNDPEMMQSISSMMSDSGTPVEMPDLHSMLSGMPHRNLPSMENLPPTANSDTSRRYIPTPDVQNSTSLGQIPELPVHDFPDDTDFKELYSEQLAQLAEFGFTNEERNIEVLKQTQGNIQFAMNRILD